MYLPLTPPMIQDRLTKVFGYVIHWKYKVLISCQKYQERMIWAITPSLDGGTGPISKNEYAVRYPVKENYALLSHMDEQIG